MNAFFATFSAAAADFTFNPKTQPELELRRLQTLLNWDRSSAFYSQVHRDFLRALVDETKAPVHTYFVQHFPDFDYDSRGSPRAEFARVCVLRGLRPGSRPYKRLRRLFVTAFDQEFDSDLDAFFKEFKTFDYNPRNEPKAEFERLHAHKGWKKKYGKSPAEQVRKEAYQAIRDEFFDAFVGVFSYYFGLTGDYHNWEYLCGLLGVIPIPETAEECKKVSETGVMRGGSLLTGCEGTGSFPCQYIQPAGPRAGADPDHILPGSRCADGVFVGREPEGHRTGVSAKCGAGKQFEVFVAEDWETAGTKPVACVGLSFLRGISRFSFLRIIDNKWDKSGVM